MIWNKSGGESLTARDAIRAGGRRQWQLVGCHHGRACTVLRARVAAIVIRVAVRMQRTVMLMPGGVIRCCVDLQRSMLRHRAEADRDRRHGAQRHQRDHQNENCVLQRAVHWTHASTAVLRLNGRQCR